MKNSSNYQIYAGHGSCIIFNKDFFSNGDILDTGFTMYGEEISTAEIAKNSKFTYLLHTIFIYNTTMNTNLLRKTSLKR